MPTSLWRALALSFATFALIVVLIDALNWQLYTNNNLDTAFPGDDGFSTVLGVEGTPAVNGGIEPGDRIAPLDGRFSPRDATSAWPAGTVLRWNVRRGEQRFVASTVVTAPTLNDIIYAETVNAIRLAMVGIAIIVALRRPDLASARALAAFFIAIGYAAYLVPAWLPDGVLIVASAVRGPILVIGLGYATLFAAVFPAPSASGIRAWIRRLALPLALLLAAASLGIAIRRVVAGGTADTGPAASIVQDSAYALLALMAIAFVIGTISARGEDRRRALWASGSVLAGFSGIIAFIISQLLNVDPWWFRYTQLTIVLIPFGLAYTILRHRTIDIGFVISRALVLTVISFIVLAAFGLLERALGKLFIDESHIASRTVEIALALGLGFSLRTLHLRVERGVDFLFFRGRQQSLTALRAFQRDVFYIADPELVVARTIEVISRHLHAADVIVVGEATAAGDDPVFVRLRASRQPVRLRDTGTALQGELAFPMVVRGTLTGALIVAAKKTGETYDPTERELLAEISERAGIALDALQTVAIRRELEALRIATGGVVPAF